MKSRRIGLVALLAALFVLLTLTPLLAQRGAGPSAQPIVEPPLIDIGPVPVFELVDQSGNAFSSAQLAGKIWVADFFLTSCQGACPVMARHMFALQDYYKDNDNVRFVSLSVDPDTDTAAVLAEYAKTHEADNSRWHFLTGPIAEIHRMAGEEGFKVGVPDNPMAHSQRFILVDARGHIRGYYDGMDQISVRTLAADIDRLLANPDL
jgi:protein SCO1/2